MTGIEIFALVTAKKQQIEELIDPTTFVLNKKVVALQKEITELQNECPHEYINGICKHCGKETDR